MVKKKINFIINLSTYDFIKNQKDQVTCTHSWGLISIEYWVRSGQVSVNIFSLYITATYTGEQNEL